MSDLVEFLRARYAEARERQMRTFRDTWEYGAACPVCVLPTESMSRYNGTPFPLASFEPCRHEVSDPALLARFEEANPDPDVLADLDSKLGILDEHPDTNDGDCGTCVEGQWGYPVLGGSRPQPHPCNTLRHLAAPFAAHPDCEERWRP